MRPGWPHEQAENPDGRLRRTATPRAIALAIVSAKPAEHFRTTPGGYFHGIVTKAKTGRLAPEPHDMGVGAMPPIRAAAAPGRAGGHDRAGMSPKA
jgi:hypothetical protein